MDSSPTSPKPAEASTGGPSSHEPGRDQPKESQQLWKRGDPAKWKTYEFLIKFLPGSPTREQLRAEGLDCCVSLEDDPSAVDLYKLVSPAKDKSTSQPREKGKRRAEHVESEQTPEEPVAKKPHVEVEVDLATWPKPPEITMWAGEVARVKGWGSNGLPTRGDVRAYESLQRDQRVEEEARSDKVEGVETAATSEPEESPSHQVGSEASPARGRKKESAIVDTSTSGVRE